MNKDQKAEAEYNVFRDSALRYMGYANEIGESFRYQVSKLDAAFHTFVLLNFMTNTYNK